MFIPLILDIRNISKRIDNLQLLNQVSLGIHKGEFFSILGASGAGKTTLLRILGGLEYPDSGEILLNGESMAGMTASLRPIHTVFQDYALFPHMSVFENIAFGLFARGVAAAEVVCIVEDMLRIMELESHATRYPDSLSGGQQQRVAIARALVNNPQVLLLDEPLSALDYSLRKKMLLDLVAIQKRFEITFVLVTHDLYEALAVSDRIAIIESGSIIGIGNPRSLYEFPPSLSVASFIGDINIIEGSVLLQESLENAWLFSSQDSTFRIYVDKGCLPHTGYTLPGFLCMCIRPECIRIYKYADIDVSKIDVTYAYLFGKIVGVIYMGVYVKVYVKVSEQTTLSAFIFPNETLYPIVQREEDVCVIWRLSDGYFFEK